MDDKRRGLQQGDAPIVAPERLWRSLSERAGEDAVREARGHEFVPGAALPMDSAGEGDAVSRRRFMALLSATAAFGAAGCSTPQDRGKMVPYTKQPPEVTPGIANYYASAFQEGTTVYPVLVKAREGRPIHLTGNDAHPHSQGKTTLRAQAEVLSLYDPDRLEDWREGGKPIKKDAAIAKLVAALSDGPARGSRALLMTGAVLSPTRRALIEELKGKAPHLVHVAFEPVADHAARAAASAAFGDGPALAPQLDRARVVLAVEADFMSTLPDSARLIRQFADRRRVRSKEDGMNRLYCIEGRMSLTGSNADHRLQLRPSRAAAFLFALAWELHEKHRLPLPYGVDSSVLSSFKLAAMVESEKLPAPVVEALAADLAGHRGQAVVLAGPVLPAAAHTAAALLNVMLEAEGRTLDACALVPLATPEELRALRADLEQGRYSVAIFWESDPVYALPDGADWKRALVQVPLCVAIGPLATETSQACSMVLAANHWLESWNDFESPGGVLTLQQPLIEPLYPDALMQGEEILLACLKALGAQRPGEYYEYLRERWQREVYPADSPAPFSAFWEAAVHDGFVQRPVAPVVRTFNGAAVAAAARDAGLGDPAHPTSSSSAHSGFELVLHPDARTWDGRYANNGWLQELPEPVSKEAWGNALALAPVDAERLEVADGDLVEISAGEAKLTVPTLVQPGQAPGVLSLALGLGKSLGSIAAGVGVNAFPLVAAESRSPYLRTGVSLTRTGGKKKIIRTQEHWALEGRDADIIGRPQTLVQYAHGDHEPHAHHDHPTLYPEHKPGAEKWGMAIDLSSCVGCSGCMIACQSENNIPTVGPEAVDRSREMHWIRIDRYYSGDPAAPEVVHQPMLCQHCDHAPCENVCPVAATTHSPDGLNQMIYNRCVGTRYCSNNCPYKVRRFNFFDYHLERVREPQEMVYNPEVTVRPRGVMEKCTFCVQRIADARMRAKAEERPVRDGEITPACAAACPAKAIVFGNLLDPESEVSRLSASDRGFKVLDFVGARPAITYLAHLSNPASPEDDHAS
ncbi:TAT-variant-translocated molybdopterin oxidoreductase [bacterium]|nr:TAT-variant-translocated molybdopterin oxidoreductase [bacterium]